MGSYHPTNGEWQVSSPMWWFIGWLIVHTSFTFGESVVLVRAMRWLASACGELFETNVMKSCYWGRIYDQWLWVLAESYLKQM